MDKEGTETSMSDISETEKDLLMVEIKLQLMESSLKSLNKIIEECQSSVDDLERLVNKLNDKDY
jgi:hypothetical protein